MAGILFKPVMNVKHIKDVEALYLAGLRLFAQCFSTLSEFVLSLLEGICANKPVSQVKSAVLERKPSMYLPTSPPCFYDQVL